MNELSLIFDRMGIDTPEVLAGRRHEVELPAISSPASSAGTASAWTRTTSPTRREELGYHPEVILAGRRINDDMGKYCRRETS